MKKIIYTLLVIILTANVLNGQGISISSEDLFAKASLSYEKKRYSDAQVLYQQLVDAGYSSKELFYNLANTYFKTKKYGYAVFYYEKAVRLDPSDEDIAFNLQLTQLYLKDKIITPPDFFVYDISKKIMRSLSVNTWLVRFCRIDIAWKNPQDATALCQNTDNNRRDLSIILYN